MRKIEFQADFVDWNFKCHFELKANLRNHDSLNMVIRYKVCRLSIVPKVNFIIRCIHAPKRQFFFQTIAIL